MFIVIFLNKNNIYLLTNCCSSNLKLKLFFLFCFFLCVVELMKKEWGCLAESISTEPAATAARYCSHFY